VNRLRIVGRVSGYSLWLVALYFLLTWLTFPWSRVEDQIAVASSDAGWALSVEDMGSAFFGVKAKGISLRPASTADGKAPEKRPAFAGVLGEGIDIDRAQVKMPMSRLPTAGFLFLKNLLSGKLAVAEVIQSAEHIDLDAEFWDGTLAVDLKTSGITNKIDLAIQDVNLDKYKLNTPFVAADPQGTLRSKGNITWHKEDPKKSAGGIDLFLDSLTIPGLPVLGDVAFSKSEAHVKLSRGRAEIRETSLEADEIQAIVEGFITLSKNVERSRLSIKLRFKVREDIDPLVNGAMMGNTRHKDDDGWYHYQLSGTLGKTRFRPSPAAARKGKRKPSKRTPTVSSSDDDSEDGAQVRSNENNGRVERSSISSTDRKSQETQRDQLREERTRRRQERKEKREEMMRKRRERQDELKQGNAGIATDNEAFAIPDDIILNGPPDQGDEGELESDEEEGEEEEGEEEEGESEEQYEEE